MADHTHPTQMPTGCAETLIDLGRSGTWRTNMHDGLRFFGECCTCLSYLANKRADNLEVDVPPGVIRTAQECECDDIEGAIAEALHTGSNMSEAPQGPGGKFVIEQLLRFLMTAVQNPELLKLILPLLITR